MNTTGCPPGRFTDQIYDYYAELGTCDSTIASLVGTMSVIIAIRFLIFLEIARLWRKTRRSEISRQKARGIATSVIRQRLPIVPTLHFLSVVILSVFFALAFTNNITASNGTTLLLVILWVTPFFSLEVFALRKLVHLGRRIIPWNGNMLGKDISKFDTRLKQLMVGMFALFFVTWISMIIGCFTDPFLFGRISLFALLVQQVLFFSSLIYQYQRCISCITVTVAEQRKSTNSLVHAKRRLQFQQLIMLMCGLGCAGTIAYFASSLASPFWGLEISFSIELASYGLIAFSFEGLRKKTQTVTRPPPTPDRPHLSNTHSLSAVVKDTGTVTPQDPLRSTGGRDTQSGQNEAITAYNTQSFQ